MSDKLEEINYEITTRYDEKSQMWYPGYISDSSERVHQLEATEFDAPCQTRELAQIIAVIMMADKTDLVGAIHYQARCNRGFAERWFNMKFTIRDMGAGG